MAFAPISSSSIPGLIRPANAESFFGSASADSIIGAGIADSGSSDGQVALSLTLSAKREINRILGYKLELTPSEKQRLTELQADITKIEAKINDGTVREDELNDRTEMIEEADRIIGKPIVEVEADDKLKEYNDLKLAILQPKLSDARKRQIEFMQRYKDNLELQISESPGRITLQQAFRSVSSQLERLNPLRSASELNPREAKAYDDIVELMNDHTGVKVEITAAETRRVEALQKAISDFQSRLPDFSQPSASQAARAYASLAL